MAHVVLIDAEQPAIEFMAAWLAQHGHSSTTVRDGNEALDVVRAERPDAIVLCVEVAQLSGYTICNKLKRDSELSAIPLALISAAASAETFEEHRRLRTRADAYAHKPLAEAAFAELVATLLPDAAAAETTAVGRTDTKGAPSATPAHQGIRFGEDPSVLDISSAPFLRDAPQTAPAAQSTKASDAHTTRAPARVHDDWSTTSAATHAELLLERQVDLSASTQVLHSADLIGRTLEELGDSEQAATAKKGTTEAAPRPRARRTTRRATAPQADDGQALQTAHAERDRALTKLASTESELASVRADLDAVRAELAAALDAQATAEHASLSLRRRIESLLEPS